MGQRAAADFAKGGDSGGFNLLPQGGGGGNANNRDAGGKKRDSLDW